MGARIRFSPMQSYEKVLDGATEKTSSVDVYVEDDYAGSIIMGYNEEKEAWYTPKPVFWANIKREDECTLHEAKLRLVGEVRTKLYERGYR